jgi:hypothetical protein
MANLGSVVLFHPDGTPAPLADYAGRPAIVQVLRYYG